MDHSGRVVVVTGGSRGIGRAVALKFAQEKARIVIVHFDPDESDADDTLKMLSQQEVEAEGHRVDVSSFGDVEELFKKIYSGFGKVDVLVNNAGITRDTLLMRMSEDDWDTVINVNLKSVFNCTKAVIRSMIKQREGRIVNISSIAGQVGNPGQANYAASKAGIVGFTKSIAKEVGARGITVNAVAPGFIQTEMTESLSEETKKTYLAQIPMGRIGTPEDVSEAVYWFCCPASSYITGQVIHVNGGMYM